MEHLAKKTTILFPPDLHRRLVRLAEQRGTSLGELVRAACQRELGTATTPRRVPAVRETGGERVATSLGAHATAVASLADALGLESGESPGEAAVRALEERLDRLGGQRVGDELAAELLAISRRCGALPVRDARPVDEILGYDDHGLLA